MQFGSRCLVFLRLACDRSCPRRRSPVPCFLFQRGFKRECALPHIYIHAYIYVCTYMFMFPFYFPFLSLFVFLDLPTANLYPSCSFSAMFFNVKTLGLSLRWPFFSSVGYRVLAFAPEERLHIRVCVRACVRMLCMCARAFRSFPLFSRQLVQ